MRIIMHAKIFQEVRDLIEDYGNIMAKQWGSFVKLYPDDLRKLCLDLISPSLIKLTEFFGAAIAKIDSNFWLNFYFPIIDNFRIVSFYSDLILSGSKKVREAVEFWGRILAGERMMVPNKVPLVQANKDALNRMRDKCTIDDNIMIYLEDDDVSSILAEPLVDKLLELRKPRSEYRAEIKFNIDDAPREMLLDDFRKMWGIAERAKEFKFVLTGYVYTWSDGKPYVKDLQVILSGARVCDYCIRGTRKYQKFLDGYAFLDAEKSLTAAVVCAEFLREKLKS